MPWPDLFWKSKKPKADAAPTPVADAHQSVAPEPPQPPTIKPVPASATVAGPSVPLATPPPATPVAAPIPVPTPVKPSASPTIPATHGVVLRPPTGRTVQANATLPQIQPPRAANPPKPPKPPEPMKNIEQLMEEADPVRTLRQTGNVRVLAPLSASIRETTPLAPAAVKNTSVAPQAEPTVTRTNSPVAAIPPAANLTPVPTPTFRPAVTAPFTQVRRIEPNPAKPALTSTAAQSPRIIPVPKAVPTLVPTPVAAPAPQPPPAEVLAKPVPAPEENDAPFIMKSAPVETKVTPSNHDGATKILPPAAVPPASIGSIFRRKARMADVARIVLPPKRDDTQLLRPAPVVAPENSATVVPPAFPVVAMTARATQALPRTVPPVVAPVVAKEAAPENVAVENKPATPPPVPPDSDDSFILKPEKARTTPVDVVPAGIVGTSNTELPALDKAFDFTPPGHQEPTPVVAPSAPVTETKPIEPKVDPEAHRPAPTATSEPKIDPETHKTARHVEPKIESKPVEAVPIEPVATPVTPEKREFHLANGERIAGRVLSESPESVYVEHSTLGVITIPRANIAKRLVEIILVNGDRIVGDILAETADTLYVKHASLGMLTVPRAARSTRVVEAILKDGDRILGEVLTETETFTVIRSASLGTITVPHAKLAMLNRKVEQIEMKALPPVAELKDKATN